MLFFSLETDGQTHPLTLWAKDKIVRHISKSANMVVKPINLHKYKVHDTLQKVSIVDLLERTSRCGKF